MTATSTISITQLNAVKASEAEFEFEYLMNGAGTGIFFSVIGGQAKVVSDQITSLINDERKQAAIAEIQARTGGKKAEPVFKPFEEDIAFTNKAAAVRLTGWRGITEKFSPELGLEVVANNVDIRKQVVENSDNVANFIRL